MSDDKHEIFIHCTGCGAKLTLDAPVVIKATPAAWPAEAEGNYPMACTFDEYVQRVAALVKAAQAVEAAYDPYEKHSADDEVKALGKVLERFERRS